MHTRFAGSSVILRKSLYPSSPRLEAHWTGLRKLSPLRFGQYIRALLIQAFMVPLAPSSSSAHCSPNALPGVEPSFPGSRAAGGRGARQDSARTARQRSQRAANTDTLCDNARLHFIDLPLDADSGLVGRISQRGVAPPNEA